VLTRCYIASDLYQMDPEHYSEGLEETEYINHQSQDAGMYINAGDMLNY